MSDFNNPTRVGQDNGAGDARALFQEIYTTEVLEAFYTLNVMRNRHYVKQLTGAKSAKFPVTSTTKAKYMNPGVELQPAGRKTGEVTVNADEMLIADDFIFDLDAFMTHYDERSPILNSQAEALSKLYDSNVLRLYVQAARTALNKVGAPGGSRIVSANARTDGDAIVAAIYAARVAMDEKDVPEGETYAYLRPAQYALAVQSDKAINREFTQSQNGGVDTGKIFKINGVEIVKTNNVPIVDLSDDLVIAAAGFEPAEILEKYRGDYSNVAAILGNKWGVGSVMVKDLDVEISRQHRNKGDLLTTSLSVGSNVLRPECAAVIEIS